MIWFLVGHPTGPPLRLRRLRVLGTFFPTIIGMVDLLFGFDFLDPPLGEEPTVNLLDGLEAQKEELSALPPVANT